MVIAINFLPSFNFCHNSTSSTANSFKKSSLTKNIHLILPLHISEVSMFVLGITCVNTKVCTADNNICAKPVIKSVNTVFAVKRYVLCWILCRQNVFGFWCEMCVWGDDKIIESFRIIVTHYLIILLRVSHNQDVMFDFFCLVFSLTQDTRVLKMYQGQFYWRTCVRFLQKKMYKI